MTSPIAQNNIMTFSNQLFSLFFLLLLFLFPLLHASKPKKCSSSPWNSLKCGPFDIRFPFCDNKGFDLHCDNFDRIVLNLPICGTFLVSNIDYIKQHIAVYDPENCLAKRLLTFNLSGSPFSSLFDVEYTFFTCPNKTVLPSWYRPVPCLSNSTSTFFATTNFKETESMLQSCQIVKSLQVPVTSPFEEIDFSSYGFGYINNQSLLLQWHSPNCTSCEMQHLRCGFKNNASLKVKCYADKSGLSDKTIVIIICVSLVGVILFNVCLGCIGYYMCYTNRSVDPRERIVESRELTGMSTKGLDQSTIESYKKMQLGESRRLPGNNGIVCPICLAEYASNETIRFIPECDHCFHVECIDAWLKIHGSCPICRNSRA